MALAFILPPPQLPHAILVRVQKTEIAPVISERGHLIQIAVYPVRLEDKQGTVSHPRNCQQ